MENLKSKINKLLSERPIPVEQIVEALSFASIKGDKTDLFVLKKLAELHDVFDQYLAIPALVLLPAWGLDGIEIVIKQAFKGPHKSAALSLLACLSKGKIPTSQDVLFLNPEYEKFIKYNISESIATTVTQKIRSYFLESLDDPFDKSSLIWSISTLGILPESNENRTNYFNFYVDLLIDSHFLLNETKISEFETLLNSSPEKEEVLQKYLTDNSIFIDPFIIELRSKHELGDDFITDYVLRRINNEYILIEIENSTDTIFTKDGQLSADLSKAISQVRDFQAWISDNIAYAQKKLPGIRRPSGLVIIGRNINLSEIEVKRLDEENYSRRGHIKIVTYDDLLNQAKVVHQNMISKPIVLKSRDQKTI